MRRDPRGFVWDARDAAEAIGAFVTGHDYKSYARDRMLRSAVERQFEIIGEALNQLSRHAPELAARVPDLRAAIDFRNMLIHGYDRIDDISVWQAIHDDLPALRLSLVQLMEALDPEP